MTERVRDAEHKMTEGEREREYVTKKESASVRDESE